MVDVDELVRRCVAASEEADVQEAIAETLREAAAQGLLRPSDQPAAGLTLLHRSASMTVIDVVWPPRFSIFPHDHRMWAAIAIYAGREENSFFRRDGSTLVASGGRELESGDVAVLGPKTVHAVANSASTYTGAIHVYGGDFIETARSQWDPITLLEEPYDLGAVQRAFADAEATVEQRKWPG